VRQIVFILVILVAFTIQSLTGFGGPLISMPIGIALLGAATVKPAITCAAWIATTLVAIPNWRSVNRREWLKMSAIMLLFMAAGLWLFKSVQLSFLQLIYGLIVMAIGIKKLFWPGTGTAPRWQMYLCIVLAGVIQGLFVSGGSFLVVYALNAMKEKQELRATLSAVWTTVNVFMIASYLLDGSLAGEALTMTGLILIPTLFATWLGSRLSDRMNKETFVKVAYILLILSGGILFVTNL
jgi:hypothetical protein